MKDKYMLVQATLSDEVIKKKSRVKCEICGREFEQITYGHLKMHGITFDEYREQFPDALLISEDLRKKLSEVQLGEKNGMFGKHHSEESNQKNREANSGEKHPNYGKRGEETSMYGRHQSEEAKQKISKGNLGKHKSEEAKQKISKANSGEKNGMKGKNHTEEARQKMRDNGMKGKHLTEEHKQHLRDSSPHLSGEEASMFGRKGELCPAYKGGISISYCEKFNDDLKERVREFFGRCCYVCGKTEAENGRKLDVHHVNYDKMMCCNDVKPLFVPLCKGCHGKTQKNREYWEEFFTISLKCLTKDQCFLPKKVNS